MSIVLRDGTMLPDIPTAYDDVNGIENAPEITSLICHTVFYSPSLNQGHLTGHFLFMTNTPFTFIPAEYTGTAMLAPIDHDNATETLGKDDFAVWYVVDDGTSEIHWQTLTAKDITDKPDTAALVQSGSGFGFYDTFLITATDYQIVWSAYDILAAVSIDEATGKVGYATEPYYKSDVSKPPFILPDGTGLPAFPDEYPCGAVFLYDGDMYILVTTPNGLYLMPDGNWTCLQDGYDVWSYDFDLEVWGLINWNTTESFSTELIGAPVELELLWTNTDVTNWAPDLFVLPDGTELPLLPDDCWDGTPYGIITNGGESIGLITTSSPTIHIPDGIVHSGAQGLDIINQPGSIKVYMLSNDSWDLMANFSVADYNGFCDKLNQIKWSNYDILCVESKNDNGTYNIGSQISYKSDVNYRITDGWMREFANIIRLLTSTTASLTPRQIEELICSI